LILALTRVFAMKFRRRLPSPNAGRGVRGEGHNELSTHNIMNPQNIQIFYHPEERLRLTIEGERSYVAVKPVWAAPLSRPNEYLSLLDGKDNEIALLPQPQKLAPDSWQAVQRELRERYLTARVQTIGEARQEYGATYWHVTTDRGEREFVTQNLQENAQWLSDTHLLLIDVDGNRFEIPDTRVLDEASQNSLDEIL
jgi:hypothetical protein